MLLRSYCSGEAGVLPQAQEPHNVLHSYHLPLANTDHWNSLTTEFSVSHFSDWASTCWREFLKQLGAQNIDKSNSLDTCPLLLNALGNLCLAYAYLADLSEPLSLIPFTVWRISAISAQNLISATKNTPWFLRQMPLRPNLSAPYCTLMGTYVFS